MKKLIIFFISSLIFTACDFSVETPNQPTTPPKHINKFTCKVNGEFWEAVPKEYEGSFKSNDLDVSFLPIHNSFYIIAENAKNGEDLSLSFNLYDTTKTVTKLRGFIFDDKCPDYYKVDTNTIKIQITKYNKDSSLLKGTFAFKVYTTNIPTCKDSLNITDVFFDLKYHY